MIQAPISLGELIDKITILQIKRRHVAGSALENVTQELHALETVLHNLGVAVDAVLVRRLEQVNAELWAIEDAIRHHEQRQCFDDAFVQLARSVYKTNDARAALKRQINTSYGSPLVEEKTYTPY